MEIICNKFWQNNEFNFTSFSIFSFVASPAFSWIDDYVDFLPSNSRKCCQFNEKNGSVCYSEDYVLNSPTCKKPSISDWDSWDYPDYSDEDVNPKINNNGPDIATKKSKATHDLWLPGMFKLKIFTEIVEC